MKVVLFIWLGLMLWNEKPFYDKYKYDIEKADVYFNSLKENLISCALQYKHDYKTMAAVVYPELMRYSIYEDFFVIKVLESLYLEGGRALADHSIGKLQMKPSFAEKLEQIVIMYPEAFSDYKEITVFASDDLYKVREERLKRLNTDKWQILYLNCFFRVMEKRFAGLKFVNQEQKIRFYATAYNHGFDAPKDEIFKYSNKKCFPVSCDCESNQYNYADVSVFFYKRFLVAEKLVKPAGTKIQPFNLNSR